MVLPLKYAPDPILERKTRRVKEVDGVIHRLVEDMIETMHDAHGVGLAANQVGVSLRVAVIQLPDDEEATVLINPEVVRREGERELTEGCLSIPGYQGLVRRSVKVRVRAQSLDGKPIRIKAEDNLMAQALEHETDHLNGVLYVEHLVDKDTLWKLGEEEEYSDGDGGEHASGSQPSSGT